MMLTSDSHSPKGTRGQTNNKIYPQAIERIKDWVAQGINRDEIAKLLGVTVGSLQVTCSKLGISLRRHLFRHGSAPHTLDPAERAIPPRSSVGIAHVREQKTVETSQTALHIAPLAKFAITMQHQGKEVATDVPLTSRAIEELALKAMVQNVGIAELVGQILVAAIKKDMIQEILRDEAPPSGA